MINGKVPLREVGVGDVIKEEGMFYVVACISGGMYILAHVADGEARTIVRMPFILVRKVDSDSWKSDHAAEMELISRNYPVLRHEST